MSMYSSLRTSRILKFLLIHAVLAVLAAAIILRNAPATHPAFPPYFITFMETFFASFAGAFLSLVQLTNNLFNGFGSAGHMNLVGHPVPLPIVAGAAAATAILFLFLAITVFGRKTMYLFFVLCSVLFMFSAYVYFVDMGNSSKIKMLGQSAIIEPDR